MVLQKILPKTIRNQEFLKIKAAYFHYQRDLRLLEGVLIKYKSINHFDSSWKLISGRFKHYFYIIFLIRNQSIANMQLTFQHANQMVTSKLTYKTSNLNTSIDAQNSSTSSNKSIGTINDHCCQYVAKWILSYNKRISRDTQYLALSYLRNLRRNQIFIAQQNYQKIAVVLLLLASKMNEIYPPKISQMLMKCKKMYSYQEIISLQGYILNLLDFQTALDSHVYAFLHRNLGDRHNDKFQESEKLLRMVCSRSDFYNYGEQILGYAIMYLIIPDLVRSMKLQDSQKIKALAIKIYNMYTDAKKKFDIEKQNRK